MQLNSFKRYVTVILISFSLFAVATAYAQVPDTVNTTPDSIKSITETKEPEREETAPKDSARLALEALPRKAAIRSAILPGLGQYHNKGLWWLKVPAIYGSLVGVGLVFEFNNRFYKSFLREAQFRSANPGQKENPLYIRLDDTGINRIKEDYRRNRDLSILGGVAVYALNIIDAYIDAKFKRFDIDDDLSLQVKPFIQQPPPFASSYAQPTPVIKFSLSF